jgi:hypothetical protein
MCGKVEGKAVETGPGGPGGVWGVRAEVVECDFGVGKEAVP